MIIGCGNGETLFSDDRTLAPPEMVQASRSLESIGAMAANVYSSGTATWCTDNNDPDPYVDLQFTSPVLITMMLTRGSTGLLSSCLFSRSRYYVTNFTLEYSPLDNSSELNYYISIDESVATPDSRMVS